MWGGYKRTVLKVQSESNAAIKLWSKIFKIERRAAMRNTLAIESALVKALKKVYDPEIPVNVYDLGLIYDIDLTEEGSLTITMTLTAPNCPLAEDLVSDVKDATLSVEGVESCEVNLVFDPPWSQDRMSEEAKLELGFL